ncbi:MAG: hypothetical protein HYY58_02395 [Candidatus Omnitrophica bacterium]|nr:hypothetical protein [Candidatus Omnitrophota bacterium]
MSRVRFQAARGSFEGVLNESLIAQALLRRLPIASTVNLWGEEIYFDVPVKMKNTAPTRDVKVGDIAYWPEGPCLCIFFGKTPASTASEPRPASPVTVVGHTDAPAQLLRSIKAGATITLDDAARHSDQAV